MCGDCRATPSFPPKPSKCCRRDYGSMRQGTISHQNRKGQLDVLDHPLQTDSRCHGGGGGARLAASTTQFRLPVEG